MTTTTTPHHDVPLPAGTTALSSFKDWGNEFRFVWREHRRVDATNIALTPCAAQLHDGSIDTDGAVSDEPPGVFIDEVEDDGEMGRKCLKVSVQGAKNLAAALIEAADAVDAWSETL